MEQYKRKFLIWIINTIGIDLETVRDVVAKQHPDWHLRKNPKRKENTDANHLRCTPEREVAAGKHLKALP